MPLPSKKQAAAALALLALAIGLLVLLYAASAHAFHGDSDGATVILEGRSMSQGHLLLGGWAISLDSFWTIDALFCLVGTAVFGLHPGMLHAIPAVIALGVVIIGVVIACEHRRGGAAIAAGGTVVAILGLPGHGLSVFFLRGPLHVGTALWCLVAFLSLRRGRFGWGWALAVVFLAAGLLGDLQMLALGVVPVFGAGLVAMARRRQWRAGLPAASAAIAAVVVAEIVRHIAIAIGTFTIAKANPIATRSQMLRNLKHGVHEGAMLMGVGGSYYGLGGEPTALSYVHVIAILVVFAAVAGTAVSLLNGVIRGRPSVVGSPSEAAWRLDDFLLLAAIASLCAFAILAISADVQFGRYLTAGVVFGAVLAGRVVGRVVQDLDRGWFLRISAALGVAIVACFAGGFAATLRQSPPVERPIVLSAFLESHRLSTGVGAYWSAAITTVDSGGRVVVRPVVSADQQNHALQSSDLVRYDRNSSKSWYAGPFQFLVFDLSLPWGGVSWQTAVATFGQPAHAYTIDDYRVMVWSHPLVVPPSGAASGGAR
ncbi:MAG: hypothetical protein ACRDZP_03320 [Acidimicrobiales bacterium]